jgi:GNAT superfamily N-acetyltransferase
MAHIRDSVLVYAPPSHKEAVRQVLSAAPPEGVFSPESCVKIAGPNSEAILGPYWHGFVDAAHFRAFEGAGERVERDDPGLADLRRACGEDEWSEAGFLQEGPVYGLRLGDLMAAAGIMVDYRAMPADVGVITHPRFRGRGLARRLASRMTEEQLPAVGVVRYSALQTNLPSLAVARSLGFIGRGENLAIGVKAE